MHVEGDVDSVRDKDSVDEEEMMEKRDGGTTPLDGEKPGELETASEQVIAKRSCW